MNTNFYSMKKIFVLAALATSLWSCEELFETIYNGLTTEEVVEGLKTALELGTDTATTNLSALNGYYGDVSVKILLPDTAQMVLDLIQSKIEFIEAFGLANEFENVVLSINRAAEEAAKDAAPIFVNAITEMSVEDAWDILNGITPGLKSTSSDFDSTAATQYFQNKTTTSLVNLFAPKINTALGKKNELGFSATQAWNTLTSAYNSAINSDAVRIAFIIFSNEADDFPSHLDSDLGIYCTQEALKGLYFKVGEEEKKIRRNPYEWAVDIIQKVFGSVFEA